MFSGAANLVKDVDLAFAIVFGICIGLFILVTFLLFLFVFKYSKKRHPKAEQIEDNLHLEIAWTIIPLILVMVIFYYGWEGYKTIFTVPKDAFAIKVTGQMWQWSFDYPNGIHTTDLYAPENRAVKLLINSTDVLHSFYIPAFRIKQDAVPGMQTQLWFEAEKTGTYDVFCAEYCGLKHSDMIAKVIILSPEEFDQWYQKNEPQENTSQPMAETQQKSAPAADPTPATKPVVL